MMIYKILDKIISYSNDATIEVNRTLVIVVSGIITGIIIQKVYKLFWGE